MLYFYRQRKVFKTRNGGLTNLDTESEVNFNERRYQKSIIAFAIGSDLSLAIFDGFAVEIKRALCD